MDDSANRNTATIIPITAVPVVVVEPIQILRPLKDYESEFAASIETCDHLFFARGILVDYDAERPLDFLKAAIMAGKEPIKKVFIKSYFNKVSVLVGDRHLTFGEWQGIFKGAEFYLPRVAATVIDCSGDAVSKEYYFERGNK